MHEPTKKANKENCLSSGIGTWVWDYQTCETSKRPHLIKLRQGKARKSDLRNYLSFWGPSRKPVGSLVN